MVNVKLNWDGLGIITSIACAIHCVGLPILISSLPFFGVNMIHNALFEWGMILLAFLVGSYALYHGIVKHHRSFWPVMIFAIGFMFLILKQFFHQLEFIFLFFAVIFIVSAHVYNYRLCRRVKCNSTHHTH